MKVLLLGSGGREYTFCHQLAKSPHQPQLFIAPGNAGTAQFGTNIEVSPTDFEGLKQAAVCSQDRNGYCWSRSPIGGRGG